MQRKVWRPRLSIDLAADVVEKVLYTGTLCAFAFVRFIWEITTLLVFVPLARGKMTGPPAGGEVANSMCNGTFTAEWS